ncbi:MAG: ubiquitin [Oscillospiraceae bacterium]|nr:ubiquitin [Oscillospiraceae bacterium]
MTQLEKVEKLREKSSVTYAEAKEALDKSGGDILDALIYLENQGKSTAPSGGGFCSTSTDGGGGITSGSGNSNTSGGNASDGSKSKKNTNDTGSGSNTSKSSTNADDNFSQAMGKFGAFCGKVFNKGFSNHLVASKGEQHLFSCPVLVVAVLVLFFFWITIPLFVISLFCGFSYRFKGKELGNDAVNSVMDGASHVADDIKKSFVENSENE